MSRPTVNVLTQSGEKSGSVELPKVFCTPVRPDLVQHIFTNLSKNSMQPHSTDPLAGVKVAAISWGTGRAKARVPRVNGSGSNRNGQGAYANFCRGGHRFAPPTLQRRWFRPVPIKQRRYAVASAIAATAITSLVAARGHKVENVVEIPIVVSSEVENIQKTRDAVAFLKAVKVYDDVKRVLEGKIHRSSKGKMRRSAFKTRKGPLVVFEKDNGLVKALRNIPGVDTISVQSLSLTQLAPGAQLGRLTVWTEGAFKALDAIYEAKRDFEIPRSIISNADIDRVYTSDEVQEVLRPKLSIVPLPKKRCCKNLSVACEEWSAALKELAVLREEEEKRVKSPEAIRALFQSAVETSIPAPENISVQIIDHKL